MLNAQYDRVMLYVESHCNTIELEHENLILITWIDVICKEACTRWYGININTALNLDS